MSLVIYVFRSLGLIVSPRIRFLQRHQKYSQKNTSSEEEINDGQAGNSEVELFKTAAPKGKEMYDFAGADNCGKMCIRDRYMFVS